MASFDMEILRNTIADQLALEPSKVRDSSLLFEELGLQSIDMVSLIGKLEERCDVEFLDIEFDGVRTVADAYAMLRDGLEAE